jgi:hypothetical protein
VQLASVFHCAVDSSKLLVKLWVLASHILRATLPRIKQRAD